MRQIIESNLEELILSKFQVILRDPNKLNKNSIIYLQEIFLRYFAETFPSYLLRDTTIAIRQGLEHKGRIFSLKENNKYHQIIHIYINYNCIPLIIESIPDNLSLPRNIYRNINNLHEDNLYSLIQASNESLVTIIRTYFSYESMRVLYHELLHGFINRIYLTEIGIQELATIKEIIEGNEVTDKINKELSSRIGNPGKYYDYHEIVSVNHKKYKELIRSNISSELQFPFFCNMYHYGVQELWIRLEEARMDYYSPYRETLNHKNLESILRILHRSYFNLCYLPSIYYFEEDDFTAELTPKKINEIIKNKILPLLDRDVIRSEWES